MRTLFTYILMAFVIVSCSAQKVPETLIIKTENNNKPKLVVGIVVDQMRYDYLSRFYNRFGDHGFKRMMREGFNAKNNHFNYVPTYTGPGHASVYTGTTPKYHGVIGNYWYDKEAKKTVYCAGDETVTSIGTNGKAGQMSPHRMVSTTFADENRLFTQMRGKTIGVSIKDRGAILPAGHTANAAYWFVGGEEGNFISSTHYMSELPQWVKQFNASNAVEKYLKEWQTLEDISTYIESGADQNNYEKGFKGKATATFPYDLKSLSKTNDNLSILRATPFGNSIVTDFALAAINAEQLGQDAITDVLAVSYSSTDYIGHNFGVNSKEIQDTYMRLDGELERLFNTLDSKIGKGNYTVFLTADHGAVDVPSYLQSLKIPAGYLDSTEAKKKLNDFMTKTFGASDLIEKFSNNQIFLNREKLQLLNLELEDVQEAIVNEVINHPHVEKAYTATTFNTTGFSSGVELLLQNGFHQKRSGDVILVYSPAFISYSKTGSTHGSGLNYDTHVPLLFFGSGIKQGNTYKKTNITDIAPTMSALLGISFPNASTGNVLQEVLK